MNHAKETPIFSRAVVGSDKIRGNEFLLSFEDSIIILARLARSLKLAFSDREALLGAISNGSKLPSETIKRVFQEFEFMGRYVHVQRKRSIKN